MYFIIYIANFKFSAPSWVGSEELRINYPNFNKKFKYGIVYEDG